MTTAKFRWTCSYMGTVWYLVTDHTGTYEAELRREFGNYEASICNGDDVRQECRSAIGILRRSSGITLANGRYSYAMPLETVAAFNAWRTAEHAERVAKLRANPERYGHIADDDPLIAAPVPAKQGDYVLGEHRWEAVAVTMAEAA